MRNLGDIITELEKLYKGRTFRESGDKTVQQLEELESRQGQYYVGEAEGWIQALEWVLEKRDKP